MNERKSRENSLIIFGFDENQSEVRQERIDHDIQQVNELYKACKIQPDTTSIKKTGRLGKFNNEKRDRPLLVTLSSVESKLVLFKNIHHIRDRPFNLKGVGVWFFASFRIFFSDNTRVRIFIFFVARSANFFFQNLTLGYMIKTLNQNIFFFLH